MKWLKGLPARWLKGISARTLLPPKTKLEKVTKWHTPISVRLKIKHWHVRYVRVIWRGLSVRCSWWWTWWMCRGCIESSESESTHLLCLHPKNQRQPLCLSKRVLGETCFRLYVQSGRTVTGPFVLGTEAYKQWFPRTGRLLHKWSKCSCCFVIRVWSQSSWHRSGRSKDCHFISPRGPRGGRNLAGLRG